MIVLCSLVRSSVSRVVLLFSLVGGSGSTSGFPRISSFPTFHSISLFSKIVASSGSVGEISFKLEE